MLLNFNITWTHYPVFNFPIAPPLNGDYAYSIDNNPPVSIASNQSTSDLFYATPSNNFKINPSFSYLVNVSNLTNGYHKIVIKASLYSYSGDYYLNESSSPTLFLVQNPTPSPTPESEPFPTTLVIASITLVAVIGIGLFVYFKRRNYAKINKHSEIEQSPT